MPGDPTTLRTHIGMLGTLPKRTPDGVSPPPGASRRQRYIGAAGVLLGSLGLQFARRKIEDARMMLDPDGDWVFEVDNEMVHIDAWYALWQIDLGRIAFGVAAFYLVASLLLFLRARHGVLLFRIAAGAAIASAVVKWYVATWPGGYSLFMQMMEASGSLVSCLVNAGFLLLLSRRGRKGAHS